MHSFILPSSSEMSSCSSLDSEKYRDFFEPGIFVCKKCKHELFSAKSKYRHDSPWPAFQETIRDDSVDKEVETVPQISSNAESLKVFCGKCKANLGHEFLGDGPDRNSRF